MKGGFAVPVLVWYGIVNFIAFAFTVYDKLAAQAGRRRVPENVLMLLGLAGGAPLEYLTMQMIRHKTLHKKFMIGLPVMIVLHLAVIGCVLYFSMR